jgi:uncharacterized damage-inducible protein DinB
LSAGASGTKVGSMAERRFRDMWVDPEDDPREGGPSLADERTTLMEYLRYQRLTLEMKCEGLDPEQLARRSVEPSTMSLLGLVRHLAEVERVWLRSRMAGLEAPRLYSSRPGEDGDWNGAVADPAVVAEAWGNWREECAFTDQFVADAPSLEMTGSGRNGGQVSLREVLVHLVEEYARHNGHADLLRERIDGRTGQ